MSAAEIFNSYRNEVVAHQCDTQFISVNRMQISLLIYLFIYFMTWRLQFVQEASRMKGECGILVPLKLYMTLKFK